MRDRDDRPVIGITMAYDDYGLIREGIEYSFIRHEYGEIIKAAGGQPIFLDYSTDPIWAAQLCDGIVITGGEDINPVFYGQDPNGSRQLESEKRTEWERCLIGACDIYGVRILGICYGNQLLNVHYGGTLYQDIASEFGSDLDHGTSTQAAYHRVKFERDFLGYETGDSVSSAARHHQAVRDLAPGLHVVARAEDGIIEAIEGYGHFGIQWHAESDGTAQTVYSEFIKLCKDIQEKNPVMALHPLPL